MVSDVGGQPWVLVSNYSYLVTFDKPAQDTTGIIELPYKWGRKIAPFIARPFKSDPCATQSGTARFSRSLGGRESS